MHPEHRTRSDPIRFDDDHQCVARVDAWIRGQDRAPRQVGHIDRGEVEGHPATAGDRIDPAAVDLHLTGPDLAIAWDEAQLRTLGQGGRLEASP